MDKGAILDAIRRIAEENGGQAPGRYQFERITGVKPSAWSGRYWARWSDALQEAGLPPNDFTAALDEEHLLERFALLVDELGRVPTNAELRLRKRTDPAFPSHNTFGRFGGKDKLLGALLTFCSGNSRFSHLAEIISPLIRPVPPEKSLDEVTEERSGYVYLMKFGKEYKIGTSNNVTRRIRQLRTQMPYEGTIVHTISTGDPEGIEAYWHSYFADKRLNGEWFALTDADVKYFKRRKLM